MRSVLGIDLGAGSLKAMVVSAEGEVLGEASVIVETSSPHPGWSEQQPWDWWRALCDAVPRALSEAGIEPRHIAAVAVSAGAHTPVLEDREGNVLRPAILWSDARSGEESRELQARYGEEIFSIACNRPAPTWTQPQILWLARHEPEVFRRTKRLYVAKDWLRSRLTGTWETDHIDATGTLLFDPRAGEWSPRLCEMIGLDTAVLPRVVKPTTVVGEVSRKAASECGLAPGTPVVCGSSDTAVEAFGAGAVEPGQGTVKLATAAAISIIGNGPSPDRNLINYPFLVPGRWYTLAATNSCASAHRWLAKCFYRQPGESLSDSFARMDAIAAEVEPGARGLLFHPYLQGERSPYWDPLLRADFVGMTFEHGSAHFVRALYEGIAFSLRDALLQLREGGLALNSAAIIGGGSKSTVWRQIIADVLGIRLIAPRTTDASFGAALVAGVGCGLFENEMKAVQAAVAKVSEYEPIAENVVFYERMHEIYRQAAHALFDVNHRLAELRLGR